MDDLKVTIVHFILFIYLFQRHIKLFKRNQSNIGLEKVQIPSGDGFLSISVY